MKKIGLLISLLTCGILLTGCFNKIEKSADTVLFEQLKQTFTGNIVDGTNSEILEITGDYTLYYNDEFGIATVLGEEWKGYSVGIRRQEDDLEYDGEVIQIERPMILFGTPMDDSQDIFLMDYHYGFSIVSNEDVEKIKVSNDVWNTSFKNDYKGENNKYSFFEASTPWRGSQRYLLVAFPDLDCRTWTGGIEYDVDGNPHEYLDADCNGYEVIDGETVKTRKSWIEQLFPYGFIFYDIN